MARNPTATTPWGKATIVDEARVSQRAGERRFTSLWQLLETAEGEQLLRIAYCSPGGTARRGPVTLRMRDLERLRASATKGSLLARLLGTPGGGA